ncbi:MAG: RNA polymerase sigma factor WhiG [Spirochaetaceae bacterium]|jgi:RNA polymerase sigma factor for flagellar operon FliA|nr:RNA polymerase sigma factor WhiG [Spirochaetaceae bacterium]
MTAVEIEEKTEDELWLEYKRTQSIELRDRFIRQYMPLVKYVAGKLAIRMPGNVEFEDLVSFGQFGLLDAVKKFDPERGNKFKTYAVTRIRGAIYDELRQLDWIPRSVRQKAREMEEVIGRLEAKLGRTATDAEIAEAMGITEAEFHQEVLKVSGTSVISISDVRYAGDEADHISIGDSLESPVSLGPEFIVEREAIKQVIAEAINELPEKEKMVLILYYHEDLTFKEIGQVLNVSESRISQLHTKANLRLRAKLTNMRKGIM